MGAKAVAFLALSSVILSASATYAMDLDRKEVLDACRSELVGAQERDVLSYAEWRAPHRRAVVVVGPAFYDLTKAEKQNVMDELQCMLTSGHNGVCVNLNMFDQTGAHVGRGRNCRYLDGPGR